MGGLFVVKKLLERTRAGKILYFADNAHAPYGRLSELRLQKVMRANCARLKDLGAKTIVLACNTATAVCIDELRAEFSDIEFVGTEPAIKPAAARYDKLTVMATPLTLKQPRFAALLKASGLSCRVHLKALLLSDLRRRSRCCVPYRAHVRIARHAARRSDLDRSVRRGQIPRDIAAIVARRNIVRCACIRLSISVVGVGAQNRPQCG